MKKSLIALAVLAAAGAASAQSSVTLYGRLDLGGVSQKFSETNNTLFSETSKTTDWAGNQNLNTTSRLGFKGTEDLGGGLKAHFNYEFGINPDVTTSVGNTRLANIAVQGGFGAVVIGTFMNSLDTVRGYSATSFNLAGGDFFGKQTDGTYASRTRGHGPVGPTAWASGSYTANQYATGLSGRSQNAIAYRAEFSGIRASIGTTSSKTTNTINNVSSTVKQQGYMLGLGYSTGPISLDLASAQYKLTSSAPIDSKRSDLALAGSYNLGFAKPYLVYEQAKSTNNILNSWTKSRGYELGATFKFDAFRPYVALNQGKQTYSGTNRTDKTSGWQVGTRYDLSKRTYLQAAYGSEKTKASGTSTNGEVGKSSGFGLGVVHQF